MVRSSSMFGLCDALGYAAMHNQMPILDTPRLQIHYEEAGSGPDVFVMVHGNFASWRWWKPVLERLPPGWRAVAPDLRGCGETPGGAPDESRSAYGIPQLADDLAGFVDGLHLDAFHLVGHSLGGAVALEYALHHQGRVRSLTLAAPPPPTGLAGMREGTSTSARLLRRVNPDHRPSMAAFRSSYRMHRSLGTNRYMLRRALPEMMPAASLDPAMAESLLADAARMSPDAVVGFLQALHRWNVEAELPGLRVPTVILWGVRDVLVPRAGLEQMAGLLPCGELVVWHDAGHSPQLERPDQFVALLALSARRLFRKHLRLLLGRAKKWCAAAFQA
jgi:3-oxoadipate enol-lactonase